MAERKFIGRTFQQNVPVTPYADARQRLRAIDQSWEFPHHYVNPFSYDPAARVPLVASSRLFRSRKSSRKHIALWIASVLFLLNATTLLARQQKQKQSSPSSTDPIATIVSSGVDKINLPEGQGDPALDRRNPRYHLTDGDVLALEFPFTPEFNQTVTVQPDGYVSLKDVGDLHIADETLPQVRSQLRESYSRILRNPEISVDLKNFESPYFLALGQVGHPGKYDLRGITTVAAAVSMAGGLTQEAKDSQVLLFRRVSENWVSVTKVDLKRMLNSKSLAEDPQLHAGDMIYVPSSKLSKISRFIPFPTLSSSLYRTPIP